MASLMSTGCGLGPFMDNYIVILSARYSAPIQVGEPLSKEGVDAWNRVAASLQASLQHPQTEEERQQLKFVEPQFFSAEVCHRRASYLLWKARRETATRTAALPSTFDVTRHSIANEISLIYQNAKASLPTIDNGDEEEDDDLAVEPINVFAQKSADEVARDQRIAEAEDELMRKVQELQVEFFDKHRKWVEVPLGTTPTTSPSKLSKEQASGLGVAAPAPLSLGAPEMNFCIENINRKMLVEVLPEELAVVFDALDISEHKPAFRRTTGRVLKTLQRLELNERFGRDREAADLLWAWIEERRGSANNSKSSTPTKSQVRPGTNEDMARQQVTAMLDMFRRMGTEASKPQPSPQYLDPLAQMKRAMNPHRPLRPSQQDYDEEESLAAAADDGEDPTRYPLPGRNTATDPRRGAAAAPQAAPQPQGSGEAAASTRSNRWNIVEYDDDDDD